MYMDWNKIGKFIAQLRKEKGITQADLSKHLYTSRENISKWERGVNCPTTETLIELSEIFEISINELLAGERKTETNTEQFESIPLKILKDADVKLKRSLIKSLIIIVGLMLIFFIYYFINTYNTIYVYKISASNENFESNDGLVLFSKNKCYLKLGEIMPISEKTIENVELYFYDKKNEKHVIYNSDDTNVMIISSYLNNEYFSFNYMKQIVKNSYIKLKYDDKEETIKLNFLRDMHNSFRIFNKDETTIENNKSQNNKTEEKIKVEETFKYDEENNLYTYEAKENDYSYKIEYSKIMGKLDIHEYKTDETIIISYSVYSNVASISIFDKSENLKEMYLYNIKSKNCDVGNCDENVINHFIKDYLNKYDF